MPRQGWRGWQRLRKEKVEGFRGKDWHWSRSEGGKGTLGRAHCSRGLGFLRGGTRVVPETTGDGPGSGPVICGRSSKRVNTFQDVGGRGCYQLILAP